MKSSTSSPAHTAPQLDSNTPAPAWDQAATGRAFTYAGAAFFTIADGFITDIWVLRDVDLLRRQLTQQAGNVAVQ